MVKKRVKTLKGKKGQPDSNSTVFVDRISKLPDSVICYILSFVPTVDAVRMSLLSRRWRRMWYSVPALQFSESVGFRRRTSFYVFVENCLMHRSNAIGHIADSVATSFKIDVYYTRESDRLVNRLSNYPIIHNYVKELDIHVTGAEPGYTPFVVLNGKSLTIIRLTGMKLSNTHSLNLPSLKSLSLEGVIVDRDAILHNLTLQCPSIEKLVLQNSNFYSDLRISSSSLKFLEIQGDCDSDIAFDFDAANLQSLVADLTSCPRISFSSCRGIRDLSLFEFCNGQDQNFDDQISKLTCLENLTLGLCEDFDHMNIVNPTLKRFSLSKTSEEAMTVTTETPNLVCFKYDGDTKFYVTMKTPNPQLSGSFTICDDSECKKEWYSKLITFFSNINCSWNCLQLHGFQDRALIIPKKLRETCCPPWPNLKHLKVTVSSFTKKKSELREGLQWLSPSLETLSINNKLRTF